jgi:hypothetical protein
MTGLWDGPRVSQRRWETVNHVAFGRGPAAIRTAPLLELEIIVTLPGPEATHRWQGRTLVDHNGRPLGSIEVIYLDKVTSQPEWALLEVGATGASRTFVPLVGAGEEGDTIRVPLARTLVEGAPAMVADRELSEDQEGELYRHYGIPYSRADSPSGLPAGEPEPDAEPPLAAGQPRPAEEPVSASTPEVAAGKPKVTDEEPTTAPEEPLPAGGGALPEAAVPESAPVPASAVPPTTTHVDEPASEAPAASEGLMGRQLRITDPRVGAGAAAALAMGVGVWRRKTIGRQVSTSMRQLGAIPATVSRRRRRRRRAKALNQAVTGATQQTTALARAMARLLAGMALLPVTVTMQSGRRVRAGVQATMGAVRRGGRRLRPGRRRRRRGGALGMVAGGAAGYVLGRQGRQTALSATHRDDQAVAATAGVKRITE